MLCILSSALYHNFLPLLVVATYILAPVPNWLCSKAENRDDFMDSGSSGIAELGRFMTGAFVAMGIALPVVLAHCHLIQFEAMAMSIVGGLLIYSTIISFTMFFTQEEEF
ncbi:Vacuolar protein sorting-associated protein 55 [Recurvomyces mirabilis]|nr:Vacuolar protein sorting-associated protein 55 [Recurvomyces mirabilis]